MKMSNNEAIKAEVEKLIASGSSNWQRLYAQLEGEYRTLHYNLAQMAATQAISEYKTVANIWGRGTGKTTFIADAIRQMMHAMPRGVGAFVSPSNQFFLTRIIPSLVQGLEMQGLYQNIHYFIGRKPPTSWKWPLPYQPPSKFNKFITFYNGFGIHMVSQDMPGDGRGLNLDFIITDESALLSKVKLEESVEPALRGSNRTAFIKSPLFGAILHNTSMPLSPTGNWLFDLEQTQLAYPDSTKVILANCKCNLHNLMPGYLEERQKTTTPWVFEAEYLNKRPRKVDNSFYAMLDEDKHGYTNYDYGYYDSIGKAVTSKGDADMVQDKPLILGIDWGGVINSMAICQNLIGEFRVLKSMYVLSDKGETQDDLAQQFIKYYASKPLKTVYIFYDNTGNVRTGNTRVTRAEQFKALLTAAGWTVILRTEGGANVRHSNKHYLFEVILKEDNPRLPIFRINKYNARDLLISMQNTQIITSSDGSIKKDKSSERKLRASDRQLATDLSDALDTAVYGLFRDTLRSAGISLPDSRFQ